MAVVKVGERSWRKPGWLLLVFVLALIPLAAAFGNWAIFQLFGVDGRYLPEGSPGQSLLYWWDAWGRAFCVAAAAWLLLTVRRVRPSTSLLLALGAAGASFLWLYVAIFVALWQAGPGALN
jgi:hypothetical protein